MQHINSSSKYFCLFFHIRRIVRKCSVFTSNITAVDAVDHDPFQRYKTIQLQDLRLRFFMEMDSNRSADITTKTADNLDELLQNLITNNKDKQVTKLINECMDKKYIFSFVILKKLFKYYSNSGRVDTIVLLQEYCMNVDHYTYIRNGEFMHYLAKAQCMKGNAEIGLSVLKNAYTKNVSLRSFYRQIFRELIYDSVLNRSEASCVIFRKYVLEYSEIFHDHYPLICYWHICWSSTWFSDQMTSKELLDRSNILQKIIRDKATTFSIYFLREYNEDAVVRLLQSLLKYNMKDEYAKVLQILFNYKLKNRDLRGCTEIVKNCKTLGISLPSDQQGRYIKMLIYKNYTDEHPEKKPKTNNFKLKF